MSLTMTLPNGAIATVAQSYFTPGFGMQVLVIGHEETFLWKNETLYDFEGKVLVPAQSIMDLVDQNTAGPIQTECIGLAGGHSLKADTEIASLNFTVLDNIIHDLLGEIDGYCEAIANKPSIACRDGCIYADQMPIETNEGAARIARIDGSVRLDEILDGVLIFDDVE